MTRAGAKILAGDDQSDGVRSAIQIEQQLGVLSTPNWLTSTDPAIQGAGLSKGHCTTLAPESVGPNRAE